MKRKLLTVICIIALILSAAGCEGETETTISGIVASVDGSVISLIKIDDQFSGERPQRGEMGERPTGEMSEGPTGERPGRPNQNENGEIPERPTGEMPERPTGEMPERPTGERSGVKGFGGEDAETVEMDLKNAHISVEIDEGKASGTLEDVTQGSFVTLTLNKKGEVTNVLVSSRSAGAFRGFNNRSGRNDPSQQEETEEQEEESNP